MAWYIAPEGAADYWKEYYALRRRIWNGEATRAEAATLDRLKSLAEAHSAGVRENWARLGIGN